MAKRNQLEDVLARVLHVEGATAASKLSGRIKRLLERDRARGCDERSRDPEESCFAFHSGDAAGRGYDNDYTEYEVFALLAALKIASHDWALDFIVGLLRRLRPELENHHQWILQQDPSALFDQKVLGAVGKPGQIVVGNTAPVFLVVGSEGGRKKSGFAAVCRGERELFELYHRGGPGYTFTNIELVNQAYAVRAALAQTTPQPRGRTRATNNPAKGKGSHGRGR
jgi:hypothetical protein